MDGSDDDPRRGKGVILSSVASKRQRTRVEEVSNLESSDLFLYVCAQQALSPTCATNLCYLVLYSTESFPGKWRIEA